MLKTHRITTVFILIVVFIIAGCGQQAEPTGTPEVTEAVIDDATPETMPTEADNETPEPTSNEPTVTPTRDTTPEVTDADTTPEATDADATREASDGDATPETNASDASDDENDATPEVTLQDQYELSVRNGLEADSVPPAEQDPPEGSRWFAVIARFANVSGETFELTESAVTLIDTDGESYDPLEGDDTVNPSLFGTYEPGDTILGLARFAIPQDATAMTLQICLDSACTETIESEIP